MGESLLDELKRYVGFGPAHEAALRDLCALATPHFPEIADTFYARILDHAEARRALTGGESRVGHLKVTLVRWMGESLGGPWNEAWWESHCRIGRVHVRIDLPQHYMFGAMNVIREELTRVIERGWPEDEPRRVRARDALGKVLDLELAIMLHTYREDLISKASRSERLATFGQLVGSIGHELRNPLGVIESSLFLLRSRVTEDERVKKHLDRIGDQVRLSNDIISGLLDMVRDRPLPMDRVALSALAGAAAESVPRPAGVSLAVLAADGLDVLGDATQIRQALVNLILNAVQAATPSGEVRVVARRDGAAIVVDVEDTGPGVVESVRDRLFEPLITTKDHGSGLGLALVKRVAERHGGSVGHQPRPGGGARFSFRIPAA
jgi:two-component system, NtrC family, sensor histidine kinase HydH